MNLEKGIECSVLWLDFPRLRTVFTPNLHHITLTWLACACFAIDVHRKRQHPPKGWRNLLLRACQMPWAITHPASSSKLVAKTAGSKITQKLCIEVDCAKNWLADPAIRIAHLYSFIFVKLWFVRISESKTLFPATQGVHNIPDANNWLGKT